MKSALIVNAGSSTYKYAVFCEKKKIISCLYQKEGKGNYTFQKNKSAKEKISKLQFENSFLNFKEREEKIFLEIDKMAFRVVHGGKTFSNPTILNKSVIKKLEKLNSLAPLHNPYSLKLIKQAQGLYPKIKKLLIFDTAFHFNLPPENHTYALPKIITQKENIKRYGFHGIVCSSLVQQMGSRLRKRAIICHLGSGSSVTALLNGKSIDTSMGYTPLEGLVMGGRAGDIDPGIILELNKKHGPKKSALILNQQSGLQALAGTNDMREVLKKAAKGDKAAVLAVEIFCKKAAKYIASFIVSLGGLDQIIFSGGIGENAPIIRRKICEYLMPFGVKINIKKNKKAEPGDNFQKTFSKIKLNYLHADEEVEMNRILNI